LAIWMIVPCGKLRPPNLTSFKASRIINDDGEYSYSLIVSWITGDLKKKKECNGYANWAPVAKH
jgi:hypothetical protein